MALTVAVRRVLIGRPWLLIPATSLIKSAVRALGTRIRPVPPIFAVAVWC